MSWTVYSDWQPRRGFPAKEMRQEFPDWSAARRQALRNTCIRGVRYVTACGPGDVVAGNWDRYTNRWREYPEAIALLAGAVAGGAR